MFYNHAKGNVWSDRAMEDHQIKMGKLLQVLECKMSIHRVIFTVAWM